jgi:hypothetical protein
VRAARESRAVLTGRLRRTNFSGSSNPSPPPSKGQKTSETSKPKPKTNPYRQLRPNSTGRHPVFACRYQGRGADACQVLQSPCETYDRIEIPEIERDVTQVSRDGGVCPGCSRRFEADPVEGSEPGSHPGSSPRGLRAFAIYPRSIQNIALARSTDVFRDLLAWRSARARWSTFSMPAARSLSSRPACWRCGCSRGALWPLLVPKGPA